MNEITARSQSLIGATVDLDRRVTAAFAGRSLDDFQQIYSELGERSAAAEKLLDEG